MMTCWIVAIKILQLKISKYFKFKKILQYLTYFCVMQQYEIYCQVSWTNLLYSQSKQNTHNILL